MKLDADAGALLAAMIAARMPRFETLTPPEARRVLAEARARSKGTLLEIGAVRDLQCVGPAGPIALRMYRPRSDTGTLPCLIYYHGGGWVLGNLDTHDALCRAVTKASGCAVLSVDYRLAPEYPYPAALDDALCALRFAAESAVDLKIDTGRLAVGGDSAGGNLAAVIALMARDGAAPPICLQVLACPALDLSLSQASHQIDEEGLAVTGPTMMWFRDHYLGTGAAHADWRISPLRAESFEEVAPCHLITAGVDPLRDEAVAFASRLAADGVDFVHEHYARQMHGFMTAGTGMPTAQRSIAAIAASMQQALWR